MTNTMTNVFYIFDLFIKEAESGDKFVRLASVDDIKVLSSLIVADSIKELSDGTGMHFKGVEYIENIEHERFGPRTHKMTLVKSCRNVEYVTSFGEEYNEPNEIVTENIGEWTVYERIENPFD